MTTKTTTKVHRANASTTQDPVAIRAEAAQAGRDDARKAYPRPSTSGAPATDYFGSAAEASARTAGMLHLAGHLHDVRPRLDRAIAELTGRVVRLTSVVGDALFKVSASDHEVQSFKRLPLAARRTPWPGWLRMSLLGVMALGTGAALAGALLELTSDEAYYVWGFCLAVTLAVVGLGAFLARTARDFEYNRLKPGEFTTGLLPKVVLGVGAAFAVLLMVALAQVRGTAAEADAGRQSQSQDSGVTVLLPDQAVTDDQTNDGINDEIREDKEQLPSIPAYAFGLLEGLLFMAAFGIEFVNYLPWAEQRQRAEKSLHAAERELHENAGQLEAACGQLLAALDERADLDAAVLITGEATLTHVVAEVSDYRRALLSHRPSTSQGGDPFPPLNDGKPQQSVTTQVAERWGRDLQPTGLVSDLPYDRLEVDQLTPTTLARGLAVLATVPERAKFTPITWDPAVLVNVAPLGVKPAQGSKNNDHGRKPARSAARTSGRGGSSGTSRNGRQA